MIPRESLCHYQNLIAFQCRERWPISSAMSQRRTSGAKALIAAAFYGTTEAVPFVGVFSAACLAVPYQVRADEGFSP
jgi:hypothetical protein